MRVCELLLSRDSQKETGKDAAAENGASRKLFSPNESYCRPNKSAE